MDKVDFFQTKFIWPEHIPLSDLRRFVLSKINTYGEPLRWAIIEVSQETSEQISRYIKVEGVVIKNE